MARDAMNVWFGVKSSKEDVTATFSKTNLSGLSRLDSHPLFWEKGKGKSSLGLSHAFLSTIFSEIAAKLSPRVKFHNYAYRILLYES